MNQRPVHPELPEKPTVTPEAKRRTAGGIPPFMVLTDLAGDAIVISTTRILAIDDEEDEQAAKHEHNSYDPDCSCSICTGECKCGEHWYKSRITLDVSTEEWFPNDDVPAHFLLSRCVRESVAEIAKLLHAAKV